jgi:poly-gamma-glutamate capsule biosynthesis protein CapA/YwtB (metallophosphatase superfamily)
MGQIQHSLHCYFRLFVFLSLASLSVDAFGAPPEDDDSEIIITMGGDFGFNDTKAVPSPIGGFCRNPDRYVPFSEMTEGIKDLFDGDLNIVNLESCVLNELPNEGLPLKTYLFSTHPTGIRHMMDLGVNVWTQANNHIWDYKEEGLRLSFKNIDSLRENYQFISVGAGLNLDEAKSVKTIVIKNKTIAIASIGIIDNLHPFHRADEKTPGTLSFRNRNGFNDYELLLKEIKAVEADYKILAIHYGREHQINLDKGQREKYHRAVELGDVDLVIGHHPHVPRPIEYFEESGRGRLIAYSLGNLLHPGTRKIEDRAPPYNFGMILRLTLKPNPAGDLRPSRLELVPLLGMHEKPYVPEIEISEKLLKSFNDQVATSLTESLQFEWDKSTPRGTAFYDFETSDSEQN